jgi:hypothetical protein
MAKKFSCSKIKKTFIKKIHTNFYSKYIYLFCSLRSQFFLLTHPKPNPNATQTFILSSNINVATYKGWENTVRKVNERKPAKQTENP